MASTPFYADGIRFTCTRCSACCRLEPGFVFLSHKDVHTLAGALNMPTEAFIQTYCRWLDLSGGERKLSLKETSAFDCVFWKDGCSVYEARPLQCRTYPFWPFMLESREDWERFSADCPGVGNGELRDCSSIEDCLSRQRVEALIWR